LGGNVPNENRPRPEDRLGDAECAALDEMLAAARILRSARKAVDVAQAEYHASVARVEVMRRRAQQLVAKSIEAAQCSS
jgi:hypothetical protein